MRIIKGSTNVKVYNEGIEILNCKTIDELTEVLNMMILNNTDEWEIELLNGILYNINNDNCSTQEVA